MSIQEDWQNDDPQPRGMSTTTKVLLALAGIGGLCSLLCCGGLFFAGFKFQQFAKNAIKQDAKSVREVTADMIQIDIPDDFEPKASMDFMFMKMVMYQHKTNQQSMLMISEFSNQFGGDQEQMRQQMRQQMQMQHSVPAPAGGAQTTIETREIDIDGEKVPFQFMKTGPGPDGKSHRQVSGAIPTKRGFVMVMIMAPEDVLDDEAVVTVLESIHLPGSAASKDKPEVKKSDTEQPAAEKTENPPAEKPPEE